MKPDWKDAPEWANWLAMEGCGTWCWHEKHPWWRFNEWVSNGLVVIASDRIDGETTLEARP